MTLPSARTADRSRPPVPRLDDAALDSPVRRRGVVALHLVGLGIIAVLILFVRLGQTGGGDLVLIHPGIGTWLAVAGTWIALGLIGWWRWGATRLLAVPDGLAVLPFVLLGIAGILVGLFVFVPVFLGLSSASNARRRALTSGQRRAVRLVVLIALLIPAVLSWWEAVSLTGFGSGSAYGLAYAAIGAMMAASVVLWLDRRAAVLLGASMWFLWLIGRGVVTALIDGTAVPGGPALVPGFAALVGVWVALADVWRTRGRSSLAVAVLAVVTFAAFQVVPIASPLVALVALAVEPPLPGPDMRMAAGPVDGSS